MDISRQDFDRLLEQIRELTTRVSRLEEIARIPETAKPAPPSPPKPAPAAEPLRPAPPPPVFIPTRPQKSEQPQSDEVNDLESKIGSHWLNRIGIAAVLIGVSFFLKYAFENNWIGPAGRIAIGLLAGIAVVVWSERFRVHGYRAFSYSLKAVGVGVLYLSLWASFQVYHLMPSEVVFAAMVIVTAATCAMALSQDAEILAIFAITGGFSTPVLLSTGQNRETSLFSYLTLLDVGIFALTILKPWRRLLLLGFTGTLALYLAWYSAFYTRSQLVPTLIFATIFFSIFALAPTLMLRQEQSHGTMPLVMAFVNAVTYFLQAYVMIMDVSHTAMAWFSIALAAVYLLLIRFRPGKPNAIAERNLRLMHLFLAVGLITVAIPIRLEAHWITIGWFVESAVLLWLAERVKSGLLNIFALCALALGVGRLLLVDDFVIARLILNIRMAVYAVAIVVLAFAAYQNTRRRDEIGRLVAAFAVITMNALALIALSREVADYYNQQMALVRPTVWTPNAWPRTNALAIARDFTFSALWMAYGAMLMIVGFWRSSAFVRWQALVLIAFTTIKVFIYDTSQLDHIYRILSFIVLGVLLLAISFAYQRDWLKLSSEKTRPEAEGSAH